MSITSFSFLCLFAVSLLLYYVIPKKAQWSFLLLLSAGYFLTSDGVKAGGWYLILYPLAAVAAVYFAALTIDSTKEQKKKLLSAGYFLTSDGVKAGGWYLILYPLAAVAAVYFAALTIDSTKEQKKKRAALICAVIFCVALLCTLKFFGLGLLVPMGISFYTLTILGYLFDVYYEIGPVQRNYAKLLLFGCYFPTMISGPILKYGEMEKQMYESRRFDYRRVTFGMQRMILGFLKKLVISERLALIANEVFNNYQSYSGLSIWAGAAAFTFQLYTDFDGCMDIVLGLSECFGIRLPENFSAPFLARSISEYWRRWHISLGNWLKDYLFYPLLRTKFFMTLPKKLKDRAPFLARSISEYWRRWHISLGNWLKDYLFYPLLRTKFFMTLPKKLKDRVGKKRAKQITTFSAMFILWFTIGYWHGGTWNFIIGSGLLHWFYIVSGELMEPLFVKWRTFFHVDTENKWFILFQRVRTFVLVMLGLIFFRNTQVLDAVYMIGRGFSGLGTELFASGVLSGIGMDWIECTIVLVSLLFTSWISVKSQKEDLREKLASVPLVLRWAILYALIFYVILLGKYGPGYSASEFIYQNFKV